MSDHADPAKAAAEGFALARHGLPLSGALPSLPRAAWLPMAVRGSTFGLPVLPARAQSAADDTDEDDIDLDAAAVVSAGERSVRGGSDDPHFAQAPHRVGPAADVPGGGLAPAQPSTIDSLGPASASASVTGAVRAAGEALLPFVSRHARGPGADTPEARDPQDWALPDALRPPAPRTVQAETGLTPAPSPARPHADPQRHEMPTRHVPSARAAETVSASASASHGEAALPVQPAVQQRPLAPAPPVASPAPARGALQKAGAHAVPAATDSRRSAEPRTIIVMGLPDAPTAARRGPASPARPAIPDLADLLGPPAEAMRSVRIDRVQVSLQTSAQPPAGVSVAAAPPASRAAASTTSARAYRNPWASNHARRD